MKSKKKGDIIDTLFTIVEERKKTKKKGSYTSFLFNKGMNKIAQKVSEETAETIIEAIQGKKKLAVQESCDLLYHLIVMWSKLGIDPSEIWNELDKRMKRSKIKRKNCTNQAAAAKIIIPTTVKGGIFNTPIYIYIYIL